MAIPAQRSFPYDGTGNDAGAYDADYFALIQQAHLGAYTRRTTAGVLLGVGNGTQESLLVEETSPQSMGVLVREGWAMVNGRSYQASEDITVAIVQNNDPSGDDRIDSIVVRIDKSTPSGTLVAKQGTVAPAPVPPSLTQNATVWEIRIADIDVINGATVITTADIDNSVREYAVKRTVKEGGTGISSVALGDILIASAANTLSVQNLADGQTIVRDVSQGDSFNARFLGIERIAGPTILGVAAATIALSSIPDKYQDLLLVIQARSTAAGTQIQATFNGDSGANYSHNQTTYDAAAAPTNNAVNNGTSVNMSNGAVQSTGTTGYFSTVNLFINNYADSTKTRSGYWNASRFESATALFRGIGVFGWENLAAAISSITLALNAGNFEIGTEYVLYGIGRNS